MNEKIILKKFAERFSELVKNSSIDIQKLADMLGIKSKSTIYRYMNGEMAPKIPMVKYASEIFNVNPLWLMGLDSPMERQIKEETFSNASTIYYILHIFYLCFHFNILTFHSQYFFQLFLIFYKTIF